MIKDRSEMETRGIEIDLTGPEGNAFNLLGRAKVFATQVGKDAKAITDEMMSGDYKHLIEVFEREFGGFVTLYK